MRFNDYVVVLINLSTTITRLNEGYVSSHSRYDFATSFTVCSGSSLPLLKTVQL